MFELILIHKTKRPEERIFTNVKEALKYLEGRKKPFYSLIVDTKGDTVVNFKRR